MNPLSRIVDLAQQAYCAVFRESELCSPAPNSGPKTFPTAELTRLIRSYEQLQTLLPPARPQGEMLIQRRLTIFSNTETRRVLEQLIQASGNSGPKDVRHTR